MKLPVRNAQGKEVRKLEVDETVFGIVPNTAVLHQAFVAQRANQRWGTAQTRSRGEVQGSTHKIRMQKYSGRARAGSARAPNRVGGGVAFGPRQRDYSQALPKKMRRLAIRSALSGKLADGQMVVIDRLAFQRPKTQEVMRILRNVGIERSALIVTGQADRVVLASARNLERTKVLPAAYLNVVDMLTHHDILMTEEAVRVAEGLWGQKAALAAPAPVAEPKRRRAAKEKAATPEVAPPPAEKAPPKPKARKAAAEAAPAPAKPARRRGPAPEAAAPTVEEARPKRRKATAKEAPVAQKPRRRAPAPEAAVPAIEEAPSRPKARRAAAVKAAPAADKPASRPRRPQAAAPETAAEEPAPKRRSRKAPTPEPEA